MSDCLIWQDSHQEVWSEILVKKKVTYSIEVDGRFVIIEDVSARVNVETGDRFFSPETVERLQQTVWERYQPVRTIETAVYEYSTFASNKPLQLS